MKINNNKLIKNYLDESLIKKMYENCFHVSAKDIKIQNLHGGLKNAVYLINNDLGSVVLKVAPHDTDKSLSIEKNNMWWEAQMLKLMEKINVLAPKLILFDDSNKICEDDYIFMSYIPGEPYLQAKENLSIDDQKNIEYQIGKISSIISSIKSNSYFLPTVPKKEFKNNYEFTCYLFNTLVKDIKANNLNIENDIILKLYEILHKNKEYLNDVTNISLCNTDLWDGNIMVCDGKVAGIVDLGDIYFCDELMNFYFHTIDSIQNNNFLQGYNKLEISNAEQIRIEIYRLYVIMKMIVDCELKEYGKFDWMYEILDKIINELNKKERAFKNLQ